MAGTSVTRWRSCNRRRQDIASRMRPQAHLPVPRGPTNTRATATGARLPISRVPRRILRKAMALSKVRLGRWLLTNITVAETTGGGPARRTITRVATAVRRPPRLPVTTMVTRRILRAIRTTAGTCSRLREHFFSRRSFTQRSFPASFSAFFLSPFLDTHYREQWLSGNPMYKIDYWYKVIQFECNNKIVRDNRIRFPSQKIYLMRADQCTFNQKDICQFFQTVHYWENNRGTQHRRNTPDYHISYSELADSTINYAVRTYPGNKVVQWHRAQKHRSRECRITSDSLGEALINRRFCVRA